MLDRTHSTLPSPWYYLPDQYHRELEAIWWREWVCVARASEWDRTGAYRVFRLGDQQVLVTRTASGQLKAFFNTCRHRGTLLCEEQGGHFRHGRIVCPYHAWTYSLQGELLATPRRPETPDFNPAEHSLYPVALDTWGGFVFVNLAEHPAELQLSIADEAENLANWPLASLALAHREVHRVRCNWKIFWENFQECYHCPGVHPALGRLVPLYGQGLTSPDDLPESSPIKAAAGALRPGAVTWSEDGQSPLPWFSSLSDEERARGQTFACFLPGMFVIAHVDYVRSVRVLPLGPEETRITVDWLLEPSTLERDDIEIARLTRFGNQVVAEDARICELNQQGLHCRRHERGVLLPQEYDVLAFDNWVLERLGSSAGA